MGGRPDKLAGWPRDLNTRLAAKTGARLKAVFSLQATPKARAKHQTNEHRSKAFNAASMRAFVVEAKPQRKRRRRAWPCYG